MSDPIQAPEPPGDSAATSGDTIASPGTPAVDRVDWISFGSTTLLAFSVYLFTLAPNLTLGFSGLMSAGAMYAGVPHPPGYPVWTIYSWLWIKLLPFSNIAWRVAVGSAFAAAVACGLVAMMVSHQGKIFFCAARIRRLEPRESVALRWVCGSVAGWVLGFSGAVWHKALLADIWALSLLLFTGVVFLLTRWMSKPERRRCLCGAFLLFGLLLTSSQELIATLPGLACFVLLGHVRMGRDLCGVVLPLALVLTTRTQFGIWLDPDLTCVNGPLLAGFLAVGVLAAAVALKTREIGSEWRPALLCGLCLLFGVAFYFFVPVVAMTNPPVNWSYARTPEGFEHLLMRGQYERIRPTSDFASFSKQLWLFVRITGREFGWLQLLLALIPFGFLRRWDPISQRWLLGSMAMFIGAGPLLLVLLNPPADLESIRLLTPYFAASQVILSLWFGFSLLLIGDSMNRPTEK